MSVTTNLSDYLSEPLISLQQDLNSKKRLLEEMANLLASDPAVNLSTKEVFSLLLDREKMGNTGIGEGVALPHSRCANTSKAVLAIISLSSPIDYDSIDKQPVRLAFGLIVPQDANDQHLSILSQIAKIVRVPGRVGTIGGFCNAHQLLEAIGGWQIDEAR